MRCIRSRAELAIPVVYGKVPEQKCIDDIKKCADELCDYVAYVIGALVLMVGVTSSISQDKLVAKLLPFAISIVITVLLLMNRRNISKMSYDFSIAQAKRTIKTTEELKEAGLTAKETADVLSNSQPFERLGVVLIGILVISILLFGFRVKLLGVPKLKIEK
jgi:hypothetical protein